MAERLVCVPHSALLVDLGNSLCKSRRLIWTTAADARWEPLQVTDDPAKLLQPHSHYDSVFVASVRSDKANTLFQRECEKAGVHFHLVKTEGQRFGLKNSYQDVSKMGVDRWLAMLGSQLFATDNYIVIDAGTAITCDAVSKNQHIGGWIAPGYNLLRKAVTTNTARVTAADIDDCELAFGQDTETCLHFGCIAQLQGLLSAGAATMAKHTTQFQTIISGGDAHLFQSLPTMNIPNAPIYVENIVLFGLLRFALSDTSLDQLKCLAKRLTR